MVTCERSGRGEGTGEAHHTFMGISYIEGRAFDDNKVLEDEIVLLFHNDVCDLEFEATSPPGAAAVVYPPLKKHSCCLSQNEGQRCSFIIPTPQFSIR